MKLVFIYGPPAAGKTTVAKELANSTGLGVFPNHELVGLIATVFPYEDKSLSDTRSQVTRSVRLQIFRKAAEAGCSFITTFGMAGSDYFDFFKDVKDEVELGGGEVCFVQLICDKEALLSRVGADSRKGKKIDTKGHLAELLGRRPEVFDKFPQVEHLSIDTTDLAPRDAARQIAGYYKLTDSGRGEQLRKESP